MSWNEPTRLTDLERRLRATTRQHDRSSSAWSTLRQRIAGRSPLELERHIRRRELRTWNLAAASVLIGLLAIQGLWSPPSGMPVSNPGELIVLDDILGISDPNESRPTSPASVLAALIDSEVSR